MKYWAIQRSFMTDSGVKSLPEYMDPLGKWCECIHHSQVFLTREDAQWFLTNYRGLSGADKINYSVAEHEICADY